MDKNCREEVFNAIGNIIWKQELNETENQCRMHMILSSQDAKTCMKLQIASSSLLMVWLLLMCYVLHSLPRPATSLYSFYCRIQGGEMIRRTRGACN